MLEPLSYRRATFEDCDLLFSWANDPRTRADSHHPEPIPYPHHVEWLKAKLAATDSWIFLILSDHSPVALLRLDQKADYLLVSYSVAKESRQKGIGKALVAMIPEVVRKENLPGDKIIAEVLTTNIASNKIFMNAGYQMREKDGFNIYRYDNS